MKKKFVISSLSIAGLTMLGFSNIEKINFDNDDRILKDVKKIDNSNKNITLSGHGSHASHSSHGSHSSHRSYYAPPEIQEQEDITNFLESETLHANVERNTLSTPVKSILSSSPAILQKKNITGTSKQIKTITFEVQLALLAKGYDIGVIDGFPGTKTMKSILQYQRENNLLETGRINDELIESLHISVDDKIS